ncbi:hypothetical protein [Flexivirga sp.]|uniref:hypothetical protein n=1 Tax=Flexivirga sp. TaxID=1962927 RepID=UPI003F81CC22
MLTWAILLIGFVFAVHLLALPCDPRTWGFCSGFLFLAGHSSLRASETAAIALRAEGLLVLILFAATYRSDDTVQRCRVPRDITGLVLLGGLLYAMSSVLDNFAVLTVITGVAFVVGVSAVAAMYRTGQSQRFVEGMTVAIQACLIIGLVMYVATPGLSIVGDRLQGFFVSANTLGFFAAIWLLHAITTKPLNYRLLVLSVPAVASILLCGSRSSAVAISAALIVLVLRSEHESNTRARARKLTATAFTGVSAMLIEGGPLVAELLRTNNSRANTTAYALHGATWHVLGGVGYGKAAVEVASTPLRWLAEEGLIAMALCVLAYLIIIKVGFRSGSRVAACATFGVVSSLLEGWYFAGVSALFVMYWAVVMAAHSATADPLRPPTTITAADAGHERHSPGKRRRRGVVLGSAK